jgi:hypothetical protein
VGNEDLATVGKEVESTLANDTTVATIPETVPSLATPQSASSEAQPKTNSTVSIQKKHLLIGAVALAIIGALGIGFAAGGKRNSAPAAVETTTATETTDTSETRTITETTPEPDPEPDQTEVGLLGKWVITHVSTTGSSGLSSNSNTANCFIFDSDHTGSMTLVGKSDTSVYNYTWEFYDTHTASDGSEFNRYKLTIDPSDNPQMSGTEILHYMFAYELDDSDQAVFFLVENDDICGAAGKV